MNRAQPLIALVVLGLALGLGGCAEEQGSARPSEPTADRSAPAPAPAPKPPPAQRAEAAVRSYYAAVNATTYRSAWNYLSPELQSELGGFEEWRDGYSLTVNTTLASVRSVRASNSQAIAAIKLIGDAIDVCGNDVSQTFQGTWTLRDLGGGFVGTDFDVAQTGGGEVVTDPAACAPPPTASPPPEEPTPSSACDPSYEGACLDPNSPDYDCEGGEGDGPDYTGPVQVVGDDHYGLDANNDGYGCESY